MTDRGWSPWVSVLPLPLMLCVPDAGASSALLSACVVGIVLLHCAKHRR